MTTTITRCVGAETWTGCYAGDYDLQPPEVMAHPAKAAWPLCFRIVEHLEQLGLLRPGDTLIDPMGGTGRFVLAGLAKGYPAVSLELEPRFIEFQQLSKAYAEKKLGRPLDWRILEGDARRLPELLRERGCVAISSPPYGGADGAMRHIGGVGANGRQEIDGKEIYDPYGSASGQVGNLPDRKRVAISSPPYEDTLSDGLSQADREKYGPLARIGQSAGQTYGSTAGQLGQESGESYLDAMRQVYAAVGEVAQVIALVTKDPTRDGKLRLLAEDTVKLLEQTGWTIHCRHKAQLFEVHETATLFGESVRKPKGRISFFKRLQFNRGGVVADHEDILIATRRAANGCVCVSSPPYAEAQTGGGIMVNGYTPGHPTARHPSGQSPADWVANQTYSQERHGATPGQIGNLPDRPMVAIMSPPYGEMVNAHQEGPGAAGVDRWDTPAAVNQSGASRKQGYGATPGQIGNLRDKGA